MTVHVFMCPKRTDDNPPSLISCCRLVLADARLFTDFIQCWNVTNSIVPFSLSKIVLQVLQVWCYNNTYYKSYIF